MSSNTVCHIPQNALHTNPMPIHERRGRIQFMILLLSPNTQQSDSAVSSGAVTRQPKGRTGQREEKVYRSVTFSELGQTCLMHHSPGLSLEKTSHHVPEKGLCLLPINLRTPALLQRPNNLKQDVTSIVHVTHQTDEIHMPQVLFDDGLEFLHNKKALDRQD